MCEAIMFVRHKNTINRGTKDYRQYKPGDIVVACDDGHRWGKRELNNEYWRIVQLPGLPWTVFQDWVCAEYAAGDLLMIRSHCVDLTSDKSNWLRSKLSVTGMGSKVYLKQAEIPRFLALKRPHDYPIARIVWQQ